MWSADALRPVDPGWAPPVQARHRPHPAAYVLAVLLPLVLLAALAAPIGLAWAVSRGAGFPGVGPLRTPTEGDAGVGDPYYPDYGSGGYDALSYILRLAWDPGEKRLSGTAVMRAKAARALDSFYVDLALPATSVTVDGTAAGHRLSGFQDLRIDPEVDVAAGAEFTVEIAYAGHPGKISRDQVKPWFETGAEWTSAGEPESSAWWFPANDHPSDPATMDLSVEVPAGVEVVSTGRLVSADTGTSETTDTWRWQTGQPVVTYATFISIGQYELRQGSAGGRPFVYAVSEQLPPDQRRRAFVELEKSAAILKRLEGVFGPYPFTEIGGIVPAHELWFGGLETQTRPIYDRGAILDGDGADRLLVHELAHMWFGDHVTLRQWNDIFINEGYASWAEWVNSERTGGRSGNEILDRAYDATKDKADFWRVTMIDPGRDELFSTVYTRGPMVLQALRNVIGDEAFLQLARDWGQQPGARSVEEWMVKAQSQTSVDLVPFFQAWIFGTEAPARTRANGFR